MKKILVIAFLTLTSMSMQAQEELTWHTDMSKATDISIKENKPMFLFFTGSDWCGWCIRLQKEVFKTPEFIKWAKDNVVLVELDFPKSKTQDQNIKMQNQQLAQTFGIQGYPTVWLVNPIKGQDNKINLTGLGSLGYDKSATNWITNANTFLAKK